MTATDWVLLAVVVVSAVFGLMRGFIGVLASLAAWVLAGWAAFRFGGQVAVVIAGGGDPGPTQLFGGYALSFLVVLIVVGLVGWGVRTLVKSVGLSGIDRFLGLALGLARGAFVACVLVLLMGFTALPQDADWRRSRTLPVFLPGALWLRGWLPDWAAAQVSFDPVRAPATTASPATAQLVERLLPAPGSVADPALAPGTGTAGDVETDAAGTHPMNPDDAPPSSPTGA